MYTRVVAFSRYGKWSPTLVKDAESKCPKLGLIFWIWLYLLWPLPFQNIMLLFLLFARYSIHWFGVRLRDDNPSRWRRHDSNVRTRRDLIYSQALLTAQPLLRLNFICALRISILCYDTHSKNVVLRRDKNLHKLRLNGWWSDLSRMQRSSKIST